MDRTRQLSNPSVLSARSCPLVTQGNANSEKRRAGAATGRLSSAVCLWQCPPVNLPFVSLACPVLPLHASPPTSQPSGAQSPRGRHQTPFRILTNGRVPLALQLPPALPPASRFVLESGLHSRPQRPLACCQGLSPIAHLLSTSALPTQPSGAVLGCPRVNAARDSQGTKKNAPRLRQRSVP